jgi:hypothetical protein
MSRVFVIVDTTQLRGVSLGQLAAYAAMVGLVKLQSGAHGDAGPSILKLFEQTAAAAPAGLTDLDQALLKSLYANSR